MILWIIFSGKRAGRPRNRGGPYRSPFANFCLCVFLIRGHYQKARYPPPPRKTATREIPGWRLSFYGVSQALPPREVPM